MTAEGVQREASGTRVQEDKNEKKKEKMETEFPQRGFLYLSEFPICVDKVYDLFMTNIRAWPGYVDHLVFSFFSPLVFLFVFRFLSRALSFYLSLSGGLKSHLTYFLRLPDRFKALCRSSEVRCCLKGLEGALATRLVG